MDITKVIEKIRKWGAAFSIPILVAVGYQLHIERVGALKDKISLLNEKIAMVHEQHQVTRYDNALNILKAQKELHQNERTQLTEQSSRLREKVSEVIKKNEILFEETIELEEILLLGGYSDEDAEEWQGQAEKWQGQAEKWQGHAEKWQGHAEKWQGQAERWQGQAERWQSLAMTLPELLKIEYEIKAIEKGCEPLFTNEDGDDPVN